MAHATQTRVFINGRSQRVTIPAEVGFKTTEVDIQRYPIIGTLSLSEEPLRLSMAEVVRQA